MKNNSRVMLSDSIMDVCLKLSEGSPGAITVLGETLKQAAFIDPDAAMPLLHVLDFDTLGIYGSRIWMLYKDVCKQDMVSMLAVLRAWQLGILHETVVHHAIDNMGEGINVPDIVDKVKAELPNFGHVDESGQGDGQD